MADMPELGKVPPEFFDEVIYPRLGKDEDSVILGPCHGVDFGVVDLGDRVIVLSTDPFYIADGVGMEKAAWFAVHIIASDIAVSGISPSYLSIDMNLPPEMTKDEFTEMWESVHSECEKLDIAIPTGHTAKYAGCNYPMVGGATMIGIGSKEDLIMPEAEPGDKVVISKGPAIEAAGLMAAYFREFMERELSTQTIEEAMDVFYQMSTVEDALTAAKVGGVTAMHDATECGVFGGLFEIASRSEVGMHIEIDNIVTQDAVMKTCEFFDMDPFKSISEGTLLATVKPDKAPAVVEALTNRDIKASIAGEVNDRAGEIIVSEEDREYRLEHPEFDPFWVRFEEYMNKKSPPSS